jgi:hypothetical protein
LNADTTLAGIDPAGEEDFAWAFEGAADQAAVRGEDETAGIALGHTKRARSNGCGCLEFRVG